MAIVAVTALLAAYAACLRLVASVRRRPFAFSAAIAAAVLVCAEALLVHGLSAFHAVGRTGLLAGQVALVAVALGLARAKCRDALRVPRIPWPPRPGGWRFLSAWIASLGLLVLLSALAYRPNNWDSMTYRLARVAHWLQNGSVGAYPTSNPRQVVLPPGAEYLLLTLQGISGSDLVAALPQYGAWLLLVLSAPALARVFGAPRRLGRWASFLVAATPLALLQASSTQNDLVAAVMTVAIVASCQRFLHQDRRRWGALDLALLGVSVVAAVLVKPTSAVAAAPFLAWTAALLGPQLGGRAAWRKVARATPLLLLAAGAVGPFLLTRAADRDPAATTRRYVYPMTAGPGERLANALRGILRNLPLPLPVVDALAPRDGTPGCERPASLCIEKNLAPSEDFSGNVVPALVVAAALLAGGARRRSLPVRSRLALAALAASWVLFHAMFRDNTWIVRLQLPLFALAPIALGGLPGRRQGGRVLDAALWVASVGLVTHATVAVALNYRRPLDPAKMMRGRSEEAYYALGPPGVAAEHRSTLDLLASTGCRKLGLYIGGDSFDYPLSWRAMQRGIAVRHVVEPDGWPCAVFSDRGAPPARAPGEWLGTAVDGLFFPAEPARK